MQSKDDSPTPAATPPVALQGDRVIALDCEFFLGKLGLLPDVRHFRASDLSAALLAQYQPSLIIVPLFAAGFDATAAIEELEALGYGGKITVLAPELPKPRLVERELQSLGPGARLTLISP